LDVALGEDGTAPAIISTKEDTSTRTEGPKIRFVNETENLGEVAEGATVEHVFVFFNEGTEPLRILEVHSS